MGASDDLPFSQDELPDTTAEDKELTALEYPDLSKDRSWLSSIGILCKSMLALQNKTINLCGIGV